MAAAPVVRDLNSIVNEISAAYAPQKELYNQQIAAAETSGQAQQAGLAAQQQQQFGKIEQGAQNKGMFFSGFSPDAQAKYTATTYLPELAKLQETINNTKTSLYGKQAEMDTQARTQAYNVREGDVAALRGWEADQAKMAWEAEQARQKMAFEAQQNAANRAASARASAASAAPKPTRDEYNNYVSTLKTRLKGFQNSGYSGELRKDLNYRGEEANALIDQFRGVISPQEINAMVNKVYGSYYVD